MTLALSTNDVTEGDEMRILSAALSPRRAARFAVLGTLLLVGSLIVPVGAVFAGSATITAVGTLYTHTNQPSLSTETISVSPVAAGNVLAMVIETKFPSGVPSFTASGASGGGVTTWKKARSSLTIDGIHGQELWWGVVTTSGPSTITVSYTSGSTSGNAESATALDVQEFRSSSGTSTVWSADGTNVVDPGFTQSTAPVFPTLTPPRPNDVYFGYLAVYDFVTPVPVTGVVFQGDLRGNWTAYDASVPLAGITPTTSGGSQTYFSIAMLLSAAAAPPATPTVTGVSPTSGSTAGGTSVAITGTNFSDASAVTFGSTNATSYTVTDTSHITATSPAGSAGTVHVTVTNTAGTSSTSSADQFTYDALPTVTGISPTSGVAAGGTSVTITGTNFVSGATVNFGANLATGVSVTNSTTITATSPAGSAGTVDVTVTTPGGTSTTGSGDKYTYYALPTVTGISPTSGVAAGGTSVAITGTNFSAVSAVKFGSTNATSYTVTDTSHITATSPAGSAGTVHVTVTNTAGTSATSGADQFTYVAPPAAPTVTGVSPMSGTTAGGTSIAITGTNFSAVSAVKFGSTNATSYTVTNSTTITATSPAGSAGTVHVTVTNTAGTSATSGADQFTYVAPPAAPTVTGVSPTSGSTAGGTSVTITGTNLTGATAVKFGTTNATSVTVNSATSITAASPAGSAATVDITVTTAGGTSATGAADHFTYVAPAPPTVTGVSPSAPAQQLSFRIQPGGGASGVAWTQQPAVAVVNSLNQVVTTDNSTVVYLSIATNPAGDSLSCTNGTSATVVNGIASFSGCSINVGSSSSYILSASSSPAWTPATSNAFAVTVAPTPVTLTGASALGASSTSGFTIKTKILKVGQSITIRIQSNPQLAGTTLGVWIAKKGSNGTWAVYKPHASVTTDATGTAYYTYRFGSGVWLAFRFYYGGSATFGPAWSYPSQFGRAM
jgi:hypothetical protein